MPRLLYIDVPFENLPGGDKNRSRFLWRTLRSAHDVDLLLIHPAGSPPPASPPPGTTPPVLELSAVRGPALASDSVHAFTAADLDRFDALLAGRRYDAVFTRFHSPWNLARRAARHPTKPKVVVDLDMLSSRLVGLTWERDRRLANRWFLFERFKLGWLERRLVRQPWLVFFSNPVERDNVSEQVAGPRSPARLEVLPNFMPDTPPVADTPPGHDILFFGSLNSAANTDAFEYLIKDLLPHLEADLRERDVRLRIVGKNPPAWFTPLLDKAGTDRVVLVGGVDSMERALAESRFVFLPLRVASGTRTRILEAAAVRRAVVTTTLGAEGIDVGSDALIADDPAELAAAVRRLFEDPVLPAHLGRRLHDRCRGLYAEPVVAAGLLRELDAFLGGSRS